jgi:hypothetical protein
MATGANVMFALYGVLFGVFLGPIAVRFFRNWLFSKRAALLPPSFLEKEKRHIRAMAMGETGAIAL